MFPSSVPGEPFKQVANRQGRHPERARIADRDLRSFPQYELSSPPVCGDYESKPPDQRISGPYCPLKTGSRFSRVARMASVESEVWKERAKLRASISITSSNLRDSAALNASLV
jgi:hypothetical protein